MFRYMIQAAQCLRQHVSRQSVSLILSLSLLLFLNPACTRFQPDAQIIQGSTYIDVIANGSDDEITFNQIGFIGFIQTRIDSAGGSSVDTTLFLSANRHDWHKYGKLTLHGLLRSTDSIWINHSDTLYMRGRFYIRTDTLSGRPALWIAREDGTSLMQVRSDGVIHTPKQTAARAYRSGTQSITGGGSAVKIQFNAEAYDTQESFDQTSNDFYADTTGTYLINAQVSVFNVSSSIENIVAVLYKNGSIYMNGAVVKTSYTGVSNYGTATITGTVSLSAGDYLDIRLYSPTNCTVDSGNSVSWFEVVKLL